MKETNNNLFDDFRKILKEKFSDAPQLSEDLWINIQKKLKEEDRNRKFYFYFKLSFIFILVVFSFAYVRSKLIGEKKIFRTLSHFNNVKKRALISERQSNKVRPKIKYDYSKKHSEKLIENKKSINKNLEIKPQISAGKVIYVGNENVTAENNLTQNQKKSLNVSNEINISNEKENIQELNNYKVIENEKKNHLSQNDTGLEIQVSSAIEVKNIDSMNTGNQNNEASDNTLLQKNDSLLKNTTHEKNESKFQPSQLIASKFNRWEIDFSLLPLYSFRKLNTTNPSSINSNEVGLISTNYGLSFGYHFNNKLNISLGVNSMKYSSSFKVDGLLVPCNTDNNTLDFETDFGSITESQDNFEGDDQNENEINENESDNIILNVSGNQNINSIQIPILVALKTDRKKLNFFIEGGIAINTITKNQIDLKVEGYKEISKINPFDFRKVTPLYIMNTGIEYNLSNNISIKLSPTFRYSMRTISTNSSLMFKPYWIGTNFSIAFRF